MDGLLPWLRRSGWAYLALACALALVAWRLAGPDDAGQPAAGAGQQTVALAPARGDRARAGARRRIVVHVAGAVRRPGVYALPEGSRVHRALMRAGGARRTADLAALNLAATLNDGQQVVIPTRSVAGAAAGAAGAG
ncbi:MAG TPA: SLBB domain-containing protein, partial [Miltoncostaeaceae bacterium]|nr:SLBB domain-containing protein [Miltoncostaeaceae bacterium]